MREIKLPLDARPKKPQPPLNVGIQRKQSRSSHPDTKLAMWTLNVLKFVVIVALVGLGQQVCSAAPDPSVIYTKFAQNMTSLLAKRSSEDSKSVCCDYSCSTTCATGTYCCYDGGCCDTGTTCCGLYCCGSAYTCSSTKVRIEGHKSVSSRFLCSQKTLPHILGASFLRSL